MMRVPQGYSHEKIPSSARSAFIPGIWHPRHPSILPPRWALPRLPVSTDNSMANNLYL